MMKFKSLIVAAALSIGGIGGISANAVAGAVMVPIEVEAPAMPEPASWSMALLGFASLGLVGFSGKNRSRRDTIPSFATAKI